MKYTPLRKFMAKIRVDNDLSLRTMAKQLDISVAFLSELELGKKSVPKNFVDKVVKTYDLKVHQKMDLLKAIIETRPIMMIDINKITDMYVRDYLIGHYIVINAKK